MNIKGLLSRNKTGDDNKQQKSDKPRLGIGLTSLSLPPAIIAALLVLGSGFIAYQQYTKVLEDQQGARHEAELQRMGAYLTARVEALGEEASRLARADEVLLEAVARADRFVLRVLEARLLEQYPELLKMRYILPSDRQPEEEEGLVPGFASLDLARVAEAGRIPPIEAHRLGTEQQHLAVVRPVYDGEAVVASLVMMLDLALLERWLAGMTPAAGLVELSQGQALRLAGLGSEAARSHASQQMPIAGTAWRLVYWPAEGNGVDALSQTAFFMVFLVVAGIVLVVLIGFGRYQSRYVQADMHRMVGFIVDSSLGKRFHSYPVKLAESKLVLHQREADLSLLSSGGHTTESIQGASGDHEIPDMLFSLDEGIIVEEESEHDKSK